MINLPAIFIANGLGACLMVIMLLSNHRNVRSGFLDDRLFSQMCLLALFLCLFETVTFCVDGRLFWGAIPLARISNALLFALNAVFSFLWTVYVDYKLFGDLRRLRRVYPYVAIPAGAVCVMAGVNLFANVFFAISPENVYSRMPLAVLAYIVTYGYLLFGAVMVVRYRRRRAEKYLFMPVATFLIPIFIGSILQLLFYGLALIWVTVAFGLTSLYINLQNEATLVDSLTKLYNRDYLTRYLSRAEQRYLSANALTGIMLDVNSFKQINDTYGHTEGDAVLRLVGRVLLKAVKGRGFAARYGGDEFIVILQNQTPEAVRQISDRIRRDIDASSRNRNCPYQLSISMGIHVYDQQADTIHSFLQAMDARMYAEKRQFYSCQANDRRAVQRRS